MRRKENGQTLVYMHEAVKKKLPIKMHLTFLIKKVVIG